MSFQIALTFEDGVTRFVENRENETVAEASYRSRINIPLDCRDGVCGTCKSFCESGKYELGDYVEDEAMTADVPTVAVPTASIPTVSVPTVSTPTVSAPTASVPSVGGIVGK